MLGTRLWSGWRVMLAWVLALGLLGGAKADVGDYVLGPGDLIHISVYQNLDLTMDARISETGTISYPLLGTVKLAGMTVTQAERKLVEGLRDGNFIKQPQVSILLTTPTANQVSVLGVVTKPGRYPLVAGSNKLSEVMAMAGGIVVGQGSDTVIVSGVREGKPFRKEVDFPRVFASTGTEPDFALQNGDTVYVDRAPLVYIYGEVQRPGAAILIRDMTVLQGLANAGGLTLRGTHRGIKIHRTDPVTGQVTILQPDLNDKLQNGDVVYVRESLF